jgi:hypothetical protein
VALTDLVPPSATVLVRRRFFKGEPLRATEAILAYLVKCRADTFHDLLADPLTPLPCADFLDRRIAEPLQEHVTISGPGAIQRLIDKGSVELRLDGIKNQALAALYGAEVGRPATADPYRIREVWTNAAAVSLVFIRGTISVGTAWWGTIPVGATGWSRTVPIGAAGHVRGFSKAAHLW